MSVGLQTSVLHYQLLSSPFTAENILYFVAQTAVIAPKMERIGLRREKYFFSIE